MRTRSKTVFWIALILTAMAFVSAFADGAIRTYLTFRVTTRTQSAIVNVGEDLQIEVGVEGVTPTRYQWYYKGTPIEINGSERVYNLINAQLEDAGLYCMEAYTGDRLALRIEVNVRVIDPTELPASGDDSLPVWMAFAALGSAAAVLAALRMRKRVFA